MQRKVRQLVTRAAVLILLAGVSFPAAALDRTVAKPAPPHFPAAGRSRQAAPAGDTFATAIVIPANYSASSGNFGFADDYWEYDYGWIYGESGPDRVYRFTTPTRGELVITLNGLSADLDLILCDGPSVNSVYDYSINAGASSERIEISRLPAGTYYLVIDGWWGATSSYSLSVSGTGPAPTPVPVPTPAPGSVAYPGDYDGDGYDDIAVFRPAIGLWAIRGVTRAYFGRGDDRTVPGDYDGDGRTDIAVFRPASGLWAIRGIGQQYFGRSGDLPVPSDYDGDGTFEPAVFRPPGGLWAVRGLTRAYFGRSGDLPVIR